MWHNECLGGEIEDGEQGQIMGRAVKWTEGGQLGAVPNIFFPISLKSSHPLVHIFSCLIFTCIYYFSFIQYVSIPI